MDIEIRVAPIPHPRYNINYQAEVKVNGATATFISGETEDEARSRAVQWAESYQAAQG